MLMTGKIGQMLRMAGINKLVNGMAIITDGKAVMPFGFLV